MPLHVAARMHALWHGLFRQSDEEETRELYRRVQRLFAEHGLDTDTARQSLITNLSIDVLVAFSCPPDDRQRKPIEQLITRLFAYEHLFLLPDIDWSIRRSVTEFWNIRDALNAQRQLVEDFPGTRELLRDAVTTILDPIYHACPFLLDPPNDRENVTVPTHLIYSLGDVGSVTEAVCNAGTAEELQDAGLLTRLSERLIGNLIEASGGNPRDPKHFSKAPKLPTKSEIRDPEELLSTYLGGTPLLEFFDQSINFAIPIRSRFEHHHIVAGSGHGKTQTLQYLIARDLEAVAKGVLRISWIAT